MGLEKMLPLNCGLLLKFYRIKSHFSNYLVRSKKTQKLRIILISFNTYYWALHITCIWFHRVLFRNYWIQEKSKFWYRHVSCQRDFTFLWFLGAPEQGIYYSSPLRSFSQSFLWKRKLIYFILENFGLRRNS